MALTRYNYTLNRLAEQVIRLFNGMRPSAEEKLEKREVVKQIRVIASELTRARWYEMRTTNEVNHLGQLYQGVFDAVPVLKDDLTGENYIFLPVTEEDMPNGDGIQSTVPPDGHQEELGATHVSPWRPKQPGQ